MKFLHLIVIATITGAGMHCTNAYALTPERKLLPTAQEECKEYLQQRIVSLYSPEAVNYYEWQCFIANSETPRHNEPEREKPSYKQIKGEEFCKAYADWSRNVKARRLKRDAGDRAWEEKCLNKPLFTSEQPRGVGSLF